MKVKNYNKILLTNNLFQHKDLREEKMNKESKILTSIIVILVIIICIFLVGVLSGIVSITINLQGSKVSGDTDKLELINYTWKTMNKDEWNEYKRIHVNVKNIAGEMIDSATATVEFYDINDNFLREVSDTIYSIPNTYREQFEIRFDADWEYYDNVVWEKMKFEFEVN